MDAAFKVTTHGRAVLAACMALELPLQLTRAAVGSGLVGGDVDLADVHQLLQYVAEGTIGERSHEQDRLYLTVQYVNDAANADVPTFLLSEFIVYAADPETGQETDLLYATLGDYRASVPAYRSGFSPGTWTFPLTVIVSGEIEVTVTAPSGLVVWDDLTMAVQRHNADPQAHDLWRHVIAARERQAGKPTYGLPQAPGPLSLHISGYTGQTEVAAVLNGVEYDAENLRVDGAHVPDGTLILKRWEE